MLNFKMKDFGLNVHISHVIPCIMEVPGHLCCIFLLEQIGRKWSLLLTVFHSTFMNLLMLIFPSGTALPVPSVQRLLPAPPFPPASCPIPANKAPWESAFCESAFCAQSPPPLQMPQHLRSRHRLLERCPAPWWADGGGADRFQTHSSQRRQGRGHCCSRAIVPVQAGEGQPSAT